MPKIEMKPSTAAAADQPKAALPPTPSKTPASTSGRAPPMSAAICAAPVRQTFRLVRSS